MDHIQSTVLQAVLILLLLHTLDMNASVSVSVDGAATNFVSISAVAGNAVSVLGSRFAETLMNKQFQ